MIETELVLTDNPGPDAYRFIDGGLAGFSAEQAGYWDARPLAVLVRGHGNGNLLGGLLGRSSLGLMFIELVFLPKQLRGRQIGSRVLAMAEEEGARRGCSAAVLYTISFHAPGFYERHGWREFGRIPCDPPGTSRIFMTKQLSPRP